jgi:hypothetical protein
MIGRRRLRLSGAIQFVTHPAALTPTLSRREWEKTGSGFAIPSPRDTG